VLKRLAKGKDERHSVLWGQIGNSWGRDCSSGVPLWGQRYVVRSETRGSDMVSSCHNFALMLVLSRGHD